MKDALVKTHSEVSYSFFSLLFQFWPWPWILKELRTTVRWGGGCLWWAAFCSKSNSNRGGVLVHMIHQICCICSDFICKGGKGIH